MDALGSHLVRLLGAVVIVVCLLPGAATAATLEPCGNIVKRGPISKAGEGLPPLIIGDSVAGWAVPALRSAGFRTNTQNCRTFAAAVQELKHIRKFGNLPKLVILNVGTGGTLRMKQIERAARLVGKGRVLGLVTPREFRQGFGHRKRVLMRQAVEQLPNTMLIDWHTYSYGHTEWFHVDNLHPVGEGTTQMATLFAIAAAYAGVELASAKG